MQASGAAGSSRPQALTGFTTSRCSPMGSWWRPGRSSMTRTWISLWPAPRSDGTLDPRFGTGGRLTTDFGGTSYASDLAVQRDGRLAAAGVAAPGPSISFGDFALARYR